MKRLLAFVVVALLAAVSVSARHNNAAFLLEVVRPLQFATSHGDEVVVGDHCTVFSARTSVHGWATAAHCVVDPESGEVRAKEFFIAGHPADIVRVDVEHDLALLQVSDGWGVEKAVKLAKKAPKVGDMLENAGYSYVWGRAFYFTGAMAINEFAAFPESQFPWFGSFASFTVIGGQSGSPVVNSDGRLVGVVSIGFGAGNYSQADPVVGFTSFEVLKAFDAGWVFDK